MRYVPFDVDRADWQARLRQLQFRFHKWDLHVAGKGTVPPGVLVLSRDEHDELVRAAEALAEMADRWQALLVDDAEALAALGIPARLTQLVQASSAGPRVTRLDLFPTEAGWQASEFNDDVPGGYNEALGLPAVLHDLVPDGLRVPDELPDAMANLLDPGPGGTLGLVYATAYAEDLQVIELLRALVTAAGPGAVVGSPAHLGAAKGQAAASLGDVPVQRIFRFFPIEWYAELAELGPWLDAVRAGVPMVNPFHVAITQSKAIFAWAWAHAAGPERALVEAHLPRTVLLDDETRKAARDDRHGLVLKPAFGRMGESVTLGAHVSDEAWRKALAAASHRAGPHVVQDRFRVRRVELAPGVTRTPCIGVYVVDGRFAGYYSRLSERPVVAYDAVNVLTAVDDGSSG